MINHIREYWRGTACLLPSPILKHAGAATRTSALIVAFSVLMLGSPACKDTRVGLDSDAPPRLNDDGTVQWHDATWHPIDDEGVFMARSASVDEANLMPRPSRRLWETISKRGWQMPVACRLVDFVDCTQRSTHGFTDDGGSRVLDTPAGRARVTAVPKGFELKWFSYLVNTSDRAGRPHLLVWESPNDQERYTTVTLTVPKGAVWSPPYAGEEQVRFDVGEGKVTVRAGNQATHVYSDEERVKAFSGAGAQQAYALSISQEPLWFEPDVGLNVYTGRDLEITNRMFLSHYMFYAKTKQMLLTVSSSGWARPADDRTGGAVSRIWVFEVLDELSERLPAMDPPASGPQRRVGVYTTHPWYFLAHYGVPPHTAEQRRESLRRLCDTLAFCGMNLIEFNAINGSDRAGAAWYPESYYKQLGADLLSELPPVAAERSIDLVPVVTSITAPGKIDGESGNSFGFSQASLQQHADPKADPRAFEHRPPDPLRPETQQWLIRHLLEIAGRCKDQPNVIGIGFRVNGKIGTCYIAGEDKSGKETKVYGAELMGYSPWNLSEFRAESGFEVPSDSMQAFKWLKEDSARWDRWLDFRCRRTRAFWLAARDAVRQVRPDWLLYVLTDLPAEVLATNIEWPGHGAPDADKVALDLLRAHGYDPRLFEADEGIVIQRVMMVDMERYWSKWGPPWGANPERYRAFHEQRSLARWYRTPAGSAVELYHTYWEEPFHPQGEFGPDAKGSGLRTATASALGRVFFRPATISLLAADNDTIVFTGWQRPVLGHEHDFRRFCQAVRALPVGEPTALLTHPAADGILANRYGDRIAVINATAAPARVTVFLEKGQDSITHLRDSAAGTIAVDIGTAGRPCFTIEMEAYDVRALAVESR